MGAQGVRGVNRDHARVDCVIELLLGIHARPPVCAKSIACRVLSCQYSRAAGYGACWASLGYKRITQESQTMAKKATAKSRSGSTRKVSKPKPKSRALVERRADGSGRRSSDDGMGDAFIKLLQSPLVADLVAVAATAALAALAEHGFTSSAGGTRGKRAGKAVKEAGKAAAAAVGRRLGNEVDEIRKASASKGGAKA